MAQPARRIASPTNLDVAARLEEIASILTTQGANPYRVQAYHRAAKTIGELSRPVTEVIAASGMVGLDELPGIGPSLAQTIFQLAANGRASMLERLRGDSDAIELLASVPGIGRRTAQHLHHAGGIHSLEELEVAAHDGRLTQLTGFRGKRLAGVRDALAGRLGRVRKSATALGELPPVGEILAVDDQYRAAAAAGKLHKIAPRRFNPNHEAWLPVMHVEHGNRHYSCMYSNTALAHQLQRTNDWVVIYFDGGAGERQCTVVTETRGALLGRRVVRGRETECAVHYELSDGEKSG
jgi:DNA polymerase (family 10)